MSITENTITTETLVSEMDRLLVQEVPSRHSFFQLKYFVVGKEPTTQAKMWQCLREIKARRDALVALDLETEESKDRLALLKIKLCRHQKAIFNDPYGIDIGNELVELNKQEHAIICRRYERKIKSAEASLKNLDEKRRGLEDEGRFFTETYKNLEKVEKLKPFDDLESQKNYWGTKLSEKINLKMLLQNPLDIELTETVLALPDDVPAKVQMVNRLTAVQNQLLEVKEKYKQEMLKNKSGK